MQDFSTQGYWWIPGQRESGVTGTLIYNSISGAQMEVYGDPFGNWDHPKEPSFNIPVVNGETAAGKIAVLDCAWQQSTASGVSGKHSQKFTGAVVIKGGNFEGTPLFRHFSIGLSNLDMWANFREIERLPLPEQGFRLQKHPGYSVQIQGGHRVTLGTGVSEKIGPRHSSISTSTQFGVTPSAPISLEDCFHGFIDPLCDLLTLVTDVPSEPLDITAYPADAALWSHCEVGIRSTLPEAYKSANLVEPHMLLPFRDFRLEDRLCQWFALADRLRAVHGLVFGLRYSIGESIENRYLNATTAAEALHRSTFTEKRKEINISDQPVQDFINSFPCEERKLLTERLKHLNDTSLHDRLLELLEKAGSAFNEIAPNRDAWVRKVKRPRNELTHQDGQSRIKLSPSQLVTLGESVAMLVTTCLLIDLNFSERQVREMLTRLPRYKWLLSEMRKHFKDLYAEGRSLTAAPGNT